MREHISVISLILQIMLISIQKNVALGQSKYKESSGRGLCDCGKEKENLLGVVSIFKKNFEEIEQSKQSEAEKDF